MRTTHGCVFFAVALVLMALGGIWSPAADGQTWGIEAGFSATANPSGVWTYGYQTSLGGALVPYPMCYNSNGIALWCVGGNPDNVGTVTKNTSGVPFDNGMYWAPGAMTMHPGPSDQKATIRWTAPDAATVSIGVTFFGDNWAAGSGATTDVHVLRNGSALFDGSVSGYGGPVHANFGSSPIQTYNGTTTVAQGDTVDFAVGYGGNGFSCDLTGITGWIAIATPGQPIVNEIQSANSNTATDEDGDHPDWVEICNAGGTPVNLLDYGLSDDATLPFKWTFPSYDLQPGQYLLVFASDKDRKTGPYFHTNYAIKSGGEPILLTAPDGTLVSQIPATSIPQDMSYGRKPDGESNMLLFADPTPGAPNTTMGYTGVLTTPPVFSRARGFYTSGFNLTLTTSVSGATIHYTTDGSEPTESSPTYTAPIAVSAAASGAPLVTVVRARITKTDYAPSPVATNSYFVGPSSGAYYNLPIVSLATDHANFFDPEIGIYVTGNHNNYQQDGDAWERPIHVELFEPGGTGGFHCEGGVRIHGAGSAVLAQKSLRLYADHQNGPGSFDYPIFPESTFTDYKRIVLRNGGNENPLDTTYGVRYTLIRDGTMCSLLSGLDVDVQHYRPSLVFFNGEYWGVFGILDREDKYWIADRHPEVDLDNIDLLEERVTYSVSEGDGVEWEALRAYLYDNDLIVPANYEYVKTKMDVSEILIHHIACIYAGNTDWPGNNIRFWRPRTPEGRWRWALFDEDFSLGLHTAVNFDALGFATARGSTVWTNEDNMTIYLGSLLRNREARDEFINRTADMLNTVFEPTNVVAKINSLQTALSPNMPAHFTRWGAGNITTWNSNVQLMKDFANARPGYMRSSYVKFFRLSGTANLSLASSITNAGSITLNTIDIPASSLPWQGVYFQDIPITLTAMPAVGYRFVRWNGAGLGTANPAKVELTSDAVVTAVFEPVSYAARTIREGSALPTILVNNAQEVTP